MAGQSFKKCIVEELVSDLENSPWSVMDIFDSFYDKWEYLSIFWTVVDKHALVRKARVSECSLSPWITEEVATEDN